MRFTGRLTYMDYDLKTYRKSLDDAMAVQMRQAARAWLRAILSFQLPVIRGVSSGPGIPPVWTGTARGTLIPLGKFLGVAVKINPVVTLPGRGPQVGAGLGSFDLSTKFDRYYFRFSTQLAYFIENEFQAVNKKYRLIHKTPWNGFKIGQKAFQDYCRNEMPKKLPKVISAIRFKTRIIK